MRQNKRQPWRGEDDVVINKGTWFGSRSFNAGIYYRQKVVNLWNFLLQEAMDDGSLEVFKMEV